MKQVSLASKAITVIFAALFLVACESGPSEKEQQAAAEAEAAEKARQAEQMRREAEERAAAERAAAELKALEDAAASAGSTVFFGFDEYSLTADTRRILDAHIALAKVSKRNIRLEGHTDERGTREYNMALGERRAKAVADYMIGNGVATYRIETVSYGEERPAAQGSNETAWSQNRRVEIR